MAVVLVRVAAGVEGPDGAQGLVEDMEVHRDEFVGGDCDGCSSRTTA